MRKNGFWRWISVVVLVLGVILVGCSNGSTNGGDGSGGGGGGGGSSTLTIQNLPGSGIVQIFSNATPTSYIHFTSLASAPVAFCVNVQTSPFDLLKNDGKAWTGNGEYLVVFTISGEIYYKSDVSFKNGSATMDFSSMINANTLPDM